MKTLEEIKYEYANRLGFSSWNELVEYFIMWDNGKLNEHINEICKIYSLEVSKESLKNASENGKVILSYDTLTNESVYLLNKQSILSLDNIPEL